MPTKSKGPRGSADRLFSAIIRGRGECQAIGQEWHPTCAGRLECSHLISRRYSWTRTDEQNALCLCSSAHRYVGADPGAHFYLGHQIFGLGHWLALRNLASNRDKFDWDAEIVRLRAI
jgi:hypothetical protein